ncbi:MAG: hypothetical protein H6741_22145 [Alphaproteobacteria bacterium]|nr:hypothetical protein [Alphaproteobacteria bacterium]
MALLSLGLLAAALASEASESTASSSPEAPEPAARPLSLQLRRPVALAWTGCGLQIVGVPLGLAAGALITDRWNLGRSGSPSVNLVFGALIGAGVLHGAGRGLTLGANLLTGRRLLEMQALPERAWLPAMVSAGGGLVLLGALTAPELVGFGRPLGTGLVVLGTVALVAGPFVQSAALTRAAWRAPRGAAPAVQVDGLQVGVLEQGASLELSGRF